MPSLNAFALITPFMCLFALGVMAMPVSQGPHKQMTLSHNTDCNGELICEIELSDSRK
jgi:hypothetical protein